MKRKHGSWDDSEQGYSEKGYRENRFWDSDVDDDPLFDTDFDRDDPQNDGRLFLEEAHAALSKLNQKTHKRERERPAKPFRRADGWH